MKKLLGIVVLGLLLCLSAKADDIGDFQIEGISIGDSLLNHLNKDEIFNAKRNYFTDERNYYVVGFTKNLKNYEVVDVYLKTGDNKYIVRTLGGMLTIDNLDECLAKKNLIKKEFDQILSHLKNTNHVKAHELDETGDSKQYQQVYYFGNASNRDNHIRIECDSWSKKIKKEMGFNDGLNIVAMTTEILDWVYSGYK
tara:strand:- start:92 stop:682 length:591 start_codon:yes stop_codon:yes gene_type:complete